MRPKSRRMKDFNNLCYSSVEENRIDILKKKYLMGYASTVVGEYIA